MGPLGCHTHASDFVGGGTPVGCSHLCPRLGVGPGCSRCLPVPFLPWAGQWMETGMSGQAGARAPPAALRAGSSARASATGLRTGAPSARATGWKRETASCSSVQVRALLQGLRVGGSGGREPLGRGETSGGSWWALVHGPGGVGGGGVTVRDQCTGGICLILYQSGLWLPRPGSRLLSPRGFLPLRPCVRTLLTPILVALCMAVSHSGREVAGLDAVGWLQRHVWRWHAAAGARLLGALLRGSSLPGPTR